MKPIEKKGAVDVIIPVRNGSRFILEALHSARKQTCPPNRIIVVDDGSTDTTRNLIERHFGDDPLVRYVYQANSGPSSARNRGILESTAEYVAFLDADDVWEREKLELQLQCFSTSKLRDLGVVYCDYINIDDEGRKLASYPCFKLDPTVRGNIFHALLTGNQVSSSDSGVLVKRELFKKAGLFDESLPSCEDWDMWLRMAQSCSFDFVKRELVRIRRHCSTLSQDQTRMFVGTLKFMNKWLPVVREDEHVLESWRKQYLMEMLLTSLKRLPETQFSLELFRTLSPQLKRTMGKRLLYSLLDLSKLLVRSLGRKLFVRRAI